MESAVWGLIGTVVGAIASLIATYITNLHSEKLSSEERNQERLEKFRSFQRETLLELQIAIHDAVRNIFLVHLEDTKAYASSGNWGKEPVHNQLVEEEMTSRRRVLLYVERVVDDSVRGAVKQLISEVQPVLYSTSKAEADRALTNFLSNSSMVTELVGKTLRATY